VAIRAAAQGSDVVGGFRDVTGMAATFWSPTIQSWFPLIIREIGGPGGSGMAGQMALALGKVFGSSFRRVASRGWIS
jgi:hypothetical protein